MFLCNKLHGVNQRKVVLKSFGGKSYSDNPKAISEKLHEIYPEAEIVWILKDPEKKKSIVPDYVRIVKANSLEEIKELATAKVWVDNFCKPLWTYKSREQFYIQTWHGDRGFKKILHDSSFVTKHYRLIESRICDLAIAGSEYGVMQYRSAFKYNGEILRVGYPRNDILLNNNEQFVDIIHNKLHIENSRRILLYAPTLRREASNNRSNQKIGEIDLLETLRVLEEKTKENWICLVRAHSAVIGLSGVPNNEKIIDVSSYEDMADLLLVSDLLITDYSSCAGDFALMKRPIILFQSDRSEYVAKDRDFYFDIDKSPYFVAENQSDLVRIVTKITTECASENCESILRFYGSVESGVSSEQVVNYIVRRIEE